tara:strand:- start:470 stop:667 length:198 start_codon:yes stop_codon:yes gene_type:complete
MSTFWLNKNQRQWLIDEYIEQLKEFDQCDDEAAERESLQCLSNPTLIEICVDFMPLIMSLMPKNL